MEPTRIVPYKGFEIRLYVRGPIFQERLFSAMFEIVRPEGDKHVSGSVVGAAFTQASDAEDAALKEAIKAVERGRSSK